MVESSRFAIQSLDEVLIHDVEPERGPVNPTLQAAIESQLESVQTSEEAKAIIRGAYP